MSQATFSSLLSNKCDSAPTISPQDSAKHALKIKEACLEFESMFIYYLFKEMRATIPKCGFITGGKAEAYYTSLLDQELAKELSSKGGIGLTSLMRGQLGTPVTTTQSMQDHQKQDR